MSQPIDHVGKTDEIFTKGRAATYGARPQWDQSVVVSALAQAKVQPKSTLMEIGSGTGAWAGHALNSGHSVVLVDPSADMNAQAHSKLAQHGERVSFIEAKAESLDTHTLRGSVDAVVYAQAAHWNTDEKSGLAGNLEAVTTKLSEIGKPDAALIIQYYNLGFGEDDQMNSEIGRALHQAFANHIPTYEPSGTPLRNARLFQPENYSQMFNQDTGVDIAYTQLPNLVHDHAGYFKWLASYSFVKEEMLAEGQSLREKLEDIYNAHANENGEVEVPFYVQTMTGKIASAPTFEP